MQVKLRLGRGRDSRPRLAQSIAARSHLYSGAILPGNRAFNNLAYGNGGDDGNTSGTVIDFSGGKLIADALFQGVNNHD